MTTADADAVCVGRVRYAPLKSFWFLGMLCAAFVGGALTFSWAAFAVFVFATATVLLLGHSLGNHRKLVHDSFQCPGWLEYALLAWGGWGFVFWGVCARVTAAVFGHWLIGYLAHNHGVLVREVRGAAVQGRNVPLLSLLTMGECWHNNHHAFPGSARLGLAPGEWDPGWWVLQALRRVGLVWAIKLPEDLPPRPEVAPLSWHEHAR